MRVLLREEFWIPTELCLKWLSLLTTGQRPVGIAGYPRQYFNDSGIEKNPRGRQLWPNTSRARAR